MNYPYYPPPYGYPAAPVGMPIVPPVYTQARRSAGRGDAREQREGRLRRGKRRDPTSPSANEQLPPNMADDGRFGDFNLVSAAFPPLQPVKPTHPIGYQKGMNLLLLIANMVFV